MLVPSPAFRSMSLGIMLAVVFVLAATLTLLPAVLAKLGPRVDRLALPWVHSGEHRSPRFAAWARAAVAPPARLRCRRARDARRARAPGARAEDRRCPRSRSCPTGDSSRRLRAGAGRVRPRRARRAADRRPRRATAARGHAIAQARPGRRARAAAAARRGGLALIQAIPTQDPSSPAVGATIDRLRAALPAGALVGGAAAENHDLEAALSAKTPLVIGVVLGARLPAAAGRAAGAADRRRRASSPTCSRPARRSASRS